MRIPFFGGTRPADIAFVYKDREGRLVYGLPGGKTERPRLSAERAWEMWATLTLQHHFIGLPGMNVAINPRHAATVLCTVDNRLKIHDGTGAIHTLTPLMEERVNEVLDHIYAAMPGMLRAGMLHLMLNNVLVGDASYDGVTGQFALTMRGASTPFFVQEISAEAGDAIISSLKKQGFFDPPGPSGFAARKVLPARKKAEGPAAHDAALAAKMETLPAALKARVVGQDRAADELADALRLAAAGLQDENKPIGSFLFLGPTGVGKTEEARELARALDVPFLKIDMSEYKEKHNVARLIGSPPGYVNSNDGGTLTNFVKKNAHCVVMLDEIEKAHRDVFDILLQVMDDARLTDGRGATADFRKVILIMTSNLGTGLHKNTVVGFGRHGVAEDEDARSDPAVAACFSPEFVNRLDAVIRFKPLQHGDMLKIADIFIGQLRAQLEARDTVITVTAAAQDYLAAKGYDPAFGARPLKRLIREELKKPLSTEILFGALKNGGRVDVDVAPDRKSLRLVFAAAAAAPEVPGIVAKRAPSPPAPL